MKRNVRYTAVVAMFVGCVVAAVVTNTHRITTQQELNQKSIEDRKAIHAEVDALRSRLTKLEAK